MRQRRPVVLSLLLGLATLAGCAGSDAGDADTAAVAPIGDAAPVADGAAPTADTANATPGTAAPATAPAASGSAAPGGTRSGASSGTASRPARSGASGGTSTGTRSGAAASGGLEPAGGMTATGGTGTGGIRAMPWENLTPVVNEDLRRLVQAQERHFAANRSYTTDLGALGVSGREGWSVRIVRAGEHGWSAVATHGFYPGRSCVIWGGHSAEDAGAQATAANGLRGREGQPTCDPAP